MTEVINLIKQTTTLASKGEKVEILLNLNLNQWVGSFVNLSKHKFVKTIFQSLNTFVPTKEVLKY